MATREELEAAKRELIEWQDRFDNYSGNNPNKYSTNIRKASRRVRILEAALKASEDIPLSDKERHGHAPPSTKSRP